jgi:hypothetical protein
MTGHGHVVPNANGVKARCGGPALCSTCNRELAATQGAATTIRATLPQDVYDTLTTACQFIDDINVCQMVAEVQSRYDRSES